MQPHYKAKNNEFTYSFQKINDKINIINKFYHFKKWQFIDLSCPTREKSYKLLPYIFPQYLSSFQLYYIIFTRQNSPFSLIILYSILFYLNICKFTTAFSAILII